MVFFYYRRCIHVLLNPPKSARKLSYRFKFSKKLLRYFSVSIQNWISFVITYKNAVIRLSCQEQHTAP